MSGRTAEVIVGFLVVLAAGAFLTYALELEDRGPSGEGYEVIAKFGEAGGIGVGSDVQIAGVKVGRVASLSLDPVTYQARVAMRIGEDHRIPVDSVAKITSRGLLGDVHLSIDPGAEDDMMAPGDSFQYTQGALDLMGILSAFTKGGEKSSGGSGSSASGDSMDALGDF